MAGVDAVVNTVGIFREAGAQSFEAIHTRAPVALFEACVEAGVRRVVQVSALGAAADAPTEFLRSKHRADEALGALPLSSVVGTVVVRIWPPTRWGVPTHGAW